VFIFLAYPRIVSTYTKSKEELHTEEEDQRYSTLAQSKYTKYIQSFEFIIYWLANEVWDFECVMSIELAPPLRIILEVTFLITTPGNKLNPITYLIAGYLNLRVRNGRLKSFLMAFQLSLPIQQ